MVRAISVLSLAAMFVAAESVQMSAQRRGGKPPAAAAKPAPAGKKVSLEVACPVDLGKGAKSKRTFCDIAVTKDPAAGVAMRIPPHTGASTLMFDLHNRFPVAANALPFMRATALVAVLNGKSGAEIERAAVQGDLRRELDLFDRIGGAGPDGGKTVAPGRAQAVKISLPAAVTSVSIVGVRLELTDASGRSEYVAPGRPVAIGSNFRIEYVPAGAAK